MPNLYLKNIHPMGHKHKPNPDSLEKSAKYALLKPQVSIDHRLNWGASHLMLGVGAR